MQFHSKQANSVLAMSTMAFSACFAIWVIFSIIGIPIKELLDLSDTQFGFLISTPILSGSLMRLPIGILTDRYGGRNVFVILLLSVIIPLYLMGSATEYWQFIVLGLFVGIAGASFTVGVTYTARWYPPARRGLAMGIFGAGNAGAALTQIFAPSLIVLWGWQSVPRIYAVALIIVIIIFWMFSYEDPSHRSANKVSVKDQLALIRDPRIWKYCQYYSLVFGGFVGVSLWITKYYVSEYHLDLTTAALLATIFVLPSGIVRAFGGWLSDRYGAYIVTWGVLWVSWVSLFLLAYPQTAMTIKVMSGEDWVFNLGLNIWVFTTILFTLGIAWGLGKASVFKALADEFPEHFGVASGIVGLAGGLGGFLLPVLFGVLTDITRVNSSIFILLYGVTSVSLILMYFTFGRAHEAEVIQHAKEEIKDAETLRTTAHLDDQQREIISALIRPKMEKCATKLSWLLNDRKALENQLNELQKELPHYKSLYILNSAGIQITANLTSKGLDDERLGRNCASRPYMQEMFADKDFNLSENYISYDTKTPELTAIHVIRNHKNARLGFLVVDYYLADLP